MKFDRAEAIKFHDGLKDANRDLVAGYAGILKGATFTAKERWNDVKSAEFYHFLEEMNLDMKKTVKEVADYCDHLLMRIKGYK